MFPKLLKLSILFVLLLAGYNTASAAFKINRPPTLNAGLVGYWTFDGPDTNFTTNTVTDKSGNGNTGTITNMSTSTARAPGKIGQALRFDGVNDRVDVGSGVNLSNTVTFSAWVKPRNYSESGFNVFLIGGKAIGSNNFYLDFLNGSIRWVTYDNSSNFHIMSIAVGNNDWKHVVGVMDNNLQYLYANGVLQGSPLAVTWSYDDMSNSRVSVGDNYWSVQAFPGLIDEVRIYNRALSASEVKTLYNMGR